MIVNNYDTNDRRYPHKDYGRELWTNARARLAASERNNHPTLTDTWVLNIPTMPNSAAVASSMASFTIPVLRAAITRVNERSYE